MKLKTANIVSVIVALMSYCVLFFLMFVEIPNNNRDLFSFLSGFIFSSFVAGAVFYLFNYRKNTTTNSEEINNNENLK